ncbi:MAG: carbamoyltransferase C-terminal domain-containing protein [Hyphomonadaceae bacterium]
MALLLGVACGSHDASACVYNEYDLLAAVQLERVTRVKGEGGRIPWEAIDEVLAIAGQTRKDVDVIAMMRGHFPVKYFRPGSGARNLRKTIQSGIAGLFDNEMTVSAQQELARAGTASAEGMFNREAFLRDFGFRPDTKVFFFNHHFAHATPTLFHNPDWNEALLFTADGGGDWVTCSHRHFNGDEIKTIYGGDESVQGAKVVDSVAMAYGFVTKALGWKNNRHEGKVTGLAAAGEPILYDEMRSWFSVSDAGRISSSLRDNREMRERIYGLVETTTRENAAASIQRLAEEVTLASVGALLKNHPAKKLGVAGGLFANVLLNQKLLDRLPVDEVFIYPAMSDAGLCTGGVLHYLLERDGLKAWLDQRRSIKSLYLGRDYTDLIDQRLGQSSAVVRSGENPVDDAVAKLAEGEVVAIYTGGCEFGPRALGARSVMANPRDKTINDTLNARMERSEFMPFAPFVRAEDADEVFQLPAGAKQAARYMTITCFVHDKWRDKIPAVVHIDGTARPQIISRDDNPLYYDTLTAFKAKTGLPVLINTSFNVHEEPIINHPDECVRALEMDRVDHVVTNQGLYSQRKN